MKIGFRIYQLRSLVSSVRVVSCSDVGKEKSDQNEFMRKREEKKQLEAVGRDNYFKDIHNRKEKIQQLVKIKVVDFAFILFIYLFEDGRDVWISCLDV